MTQNASKDAEIERYMVNEGTEGPGAWSGARDNNLSNVSDSTPFLSSERTQNSGQGGHIHGNNAFSEKSSDKALTRPGQNKNSAIDAAEDTVGPKGLCLLLLLSLQAGLQPLSWQLCASTETSLVARLFAVEAAKVLVCGWTLQWAGKLVPLASRWQIGESLRVAALPAAIYTVQNALNQMAMYNLDGTMYLVLNQTKILSTAVLVYVVLGKKQSKRQVLALLILVAGAVMLSLAKAGARAGSGASSAGEQAVQGSNSSSNNNYNNTNNYNNAGADVSSTSTVASNSVMLGMVPGALASLLSGVAAAVVQKALQRGARDPYLFTMEMALWGSLLMALSQIASAAKQAAQQWGVVEETVSETSEVSSYNLLEGWTLSALIPVLIAAGGGVLVGLVTKHCGSVRKGFSMVLGIAVSAVADFVVYGTLLSAEAMVAVAFVVVSMYIHINYPYQTSPGAPTGSDPSRREWKKSDGPSARRVIKSESAKVGDGLLGSLNSGGDTFDAGAEGSPRNGGSINHRKHSVDADSAAQEVNATSVKLQNSSQRHVKVDFNGGHQSDKSSHVVVGDTQYSLAEEGSGKRSPSVYSVTALGGVQRVPSL